MFIIQYLKKFSPSKEKLAKYKVLTIFGDLIHNPNLWHFNRYSVPKSFSVGLFVAWIPVPFQMVLAALGAIICNANLPLSVALVWITNPITMPPLSLFAYILGTKILHLPIKPFNLELSIKGFTSILSEIWQPFLLGSLVCAAGSALVGHITMKLLWRFTTINSWKKRRKSRNKP